jgi:hypothetical protein
MPALQPAVTNDLPETPAIVPSFREQVRTPGSMLPPGWEQQLRLDQRPFTATYIGPPPRPNTLALENSQTERARWRNLVSRHSLHSDTTHYRLNDTGHIAVEDMLEMLQQMQRMEDAIVAQQVAITRG